MSSSTPRPILTAHLFPKIEALLLELLRSLDERDWERPTLAPRWTVKDVAGHLLDTAVRKLSLARDGWTTAELRPRENEGLVAFVNRMNAEGVAAWRRLSPRLLVAFTETVSSEYARHHESLDPFAEAAIGVSWAGETRSLNWFDTAREYTERWHHQQQIRLATGRPGIEARELYHPVLDCFIRALPFTYRTVERPVGTLARFTVSGDAGGSWFLHRGVQGWRLIADAVGSQESETVIPQAIAWRVFTKGIEREAARAAIDVSGDEALGLHVLEALAIVG